MSFVLYRKAGVIGILLRSGADDARAHLPQICSALTRIGALATSRGWPATVQSSTSQTAFSPRALERLAGRVLGDGPPFLLLCLGPDPDHSLAKATLFGAALPGTVSQLDFDTSLVPPGIFRFEEWRDLALQLADGTGMANGTVASPRLPEAYQAYYTETEMRAIGLGPNGLRRYLRYPGWAVWLTDGHLAALGGRDLVVRQAPAAVIIEREHGVWLQVTEDYMDVPPDVWARFEAYLEPLRPTEEDMRAADPPAPRSTRRIFVGAADQYGGYAGPALVGTWLETDEDVLGIHVQLRRPPAAKAAEALNRAVQAWYEAGSEEAFPGGGFHDISGPDWDGARVHWEVDLGFADPDAATNDLLRRLGGWSERWRTPVRAVRFGIETE